MIAAALTLKLGFWQLSRAQEKLALQASIQAQATLPSLDATALLRAISSSQQGATTATPKVLHRTTTLTGQWLRQHTLFLDNRQMEGKPGLFVLTPFVFTDSTTAAKKTILVQRGWLPRNFLDRNILPEVMTDTAETTIVGRIALSPSKLFEFKGNETGALRQNIDIEALAKELKLELLPYSLLQLDTPSANEKTNAAQDKLLRHWAQPNYGSEKNYGYMVQWWALSALITLLYVWFQWARPNLKSKNNLKQHDTNNE
jgi:surfeit locus 1 family protein